MSAHDAYARVAAYDLVNPDGEWLVLLLHGLGGDRRQALDLVGAPVDLQAALLAPDLRAHGDTSIVGDAEDFTLDALVADIVALVERLGQGRKPVYVAGVSMGAALALRLAMSRPIDVRGMALVRPAFADTPYPENLAVLPAIAELLRSVDPAVARDRLLASPEYRAIEAVTASGAMSAAQQLDKPQARERAVRLAEVPGSIAWRDDDELRRLDTPALVVGVGRDVVHPLALARRTAELLPGARYVEVTARDVDPLAYNREIRAAVRSHINAMIG